MSNDLPALPEKPGLLDYLEQFLPFRLPRIPLPQAAKNLDKAAARLLDAGSANLAARMAASTSRIRNRSQAEGKFIAAGSKAAVELVLADEPLAHRAIEHALGAAVLAQKNREAVLEIAAQELSQEAPQPADAGREIDDDWLNMFAELAAGKTDADIQTLWGKILAGEIRQPGSFSLRTMAHLSTITSEEADFIYRFMPLVIAGEYIYCGMTEKFPVTLADLVRLEELGVVTGIGGILGRHLEIKAGNKAQQLVHNFAVAITAKEDVDISIPDSVNLTSFGQQLFQLCEANVTADADFAERYARVFVGPHTTVSILKLGPRRGDGTFPVLTQTTLE